MRASSRGKGHPLIQKYKKNLSHLLFFYSPQQNNPRNLSLSTCFLDLRRFLPRSLLSPRVSRVSTPPDSKPALRLVSLPSAPLPYGLPLAGLLPPRIRAAVADVFVCICVVAAVLASRRFFSVVRSQIRRVLGGMSRGRWRNSGPGASWAAIWAASEAVASSAMLG
jgi:hypothetical protein